jgi:cell division protein FtsN
MKKTLKGEKGGFGLGLIVGLLIGLALALGVALYVTKVPVPFVNKVPQRTPEQDAAEIERNKNWDPNAPLAGKPVKPVLHGASGATAPSGPPATAPITTAPAPNVAAPTPPKSQRDPGAILSGQPVSPAAAPMVSSKAPSAKVEAAAFTYYVQAGAFARAEDAEQQRAKLALMGLAAKVTEREQSGRTVYRVRLGPFDRKEDADAAQEKLQTANVEAALVRVENAAH